MDGEQQQTDQPKQQHPLSFLQSIEWTGGGILLGIVFFLSVFLILNYFNILKLSSLYPNQLGFLPHRPYQTTNQSIKPQPIPPAPLAKKIFESALSKIIVSSLVPSSSDITLTQDQVIKENFVFSWNTDQGKASATMFTSTDGKIVSSLYFSFPETKIASPSTQLVQETTSKFFSIQPKGTWGCKPLSDTTYCENFWEEDKIKRGIGMQGPLPLTKGEIGSIVFFCEHRPGSQIYNWQSCTNQFANTGISN